jgi:hypothetical protein
MLLALVRLALAAPSTALLPPAPSAPTPDAGDLHDQLLARFEAEVELVDAGRHDAHGPGCRTGLVMDLKAHWDLFSADERARITAALAPWKQDLAAPIVHARPPAEPGQQATDSCVGQQKANRLAGEHFVVEWDDGISSAYADAFLSALEYSYGKEVEDLGWRAPSGDGRYLLPAYIESGRGQGAYTTVDFCAGGYLPFIVAQSGSWADASWADTMAAHELNHALQFSYGFAHEFWWWEATATYVEDSVYPASNWWAYYVTGYTQAPQLALNASDQQDQAIFWHMYGMAIWAFYLDEYQGGLETVRGTWEMAANERGTYVYGAWDALAELGIDFEDAYVDFALRNAAMDYADHRILPEVDTLTTVRALPAGDTVTGAARPQGYGQNYIAVNGGLGEGDLVLDFASDAGVRWAVALVEVSGAQLLRTELVEVNESGAAQLTLQDYGAEDVVVVVTPLVEGDAKRGYTWGLSLAPAEVEDTDGIDPSADDAAAEDSKSAGLACNAAPAAPSPVGALGLALGLVGATVRARRRRA